MTKKAEVKDKDTADAKKESIATGNSFEWKSTEAHKGQCHQEEEGQGNDKKRPAMNLDTDPINDHPYFDAVCNKKKSRLVSEPQKDIRKLSIPQRLDRLEASIGGSFVQRMAVLEQYCGVVNDEGMKLEDRIAQLEQVLV